MNQLPIEGQYKVYIIEDFEKLTVQGENSILKFLEEPLIIQLRYFYQRNRNKY